MNQADTNPTKMNFFVKKYNSFENFWLTGIIMTHLLLFMSRKNDHVTQKSTYKDRKLRILIRVQHFSTSDILIFFSFKSSASVFTYN